MVKRSKRSWRVKVSADGAGVVSHAGVGMLREIGDLTGLTSQVSAVLADTYKGSWVHDPGRVSRRPSPMARTVCPGSGRWSISRPSTGRWRR